MKVSELKKVLATVEGDPDVIGCWEAYWRSDLDFTKATKQLWSQDSEMVIDASELEEGEIAEEVVVLWLKP